jgi:hypothetical protein
MIARPDGSCQPDLLVCPLNTLAPSRIPREIRAEVTSLLKLLLAAHIAGDVTLPREAANE